MLTKQDKWVLQQIQEAGFEAIIAGGAIRDAYLGVQRSDVDIFIYTQDSANLRALSTSKLSSLLDLGTGMYDSVNTPQNAYYGKPGKVGSNMLERVIDVYKDQTKYQLIILKEPVMEYFAKFNIGLCKCYYDGVRYRFTNDFLKDMQNKTLTVVYAHSWEDLQKTKSRHLIKLKQKYRGYKVVIDEDKLSKNWVTKIKDEQTTHAYPWSVAGSTSGGNYRIYTSTQP